MKGEKTMRSRLFKGVLMTVAVMLASVGSARAHEGCSTAILRGDYGFAITGEVLPPAPAPAVLEAGVAMDHFDGRGNITQSDFITLGGVAAVPNDEFRQGGTGTYTVNSDCTGSASISPAPGAQIEMKFVVVKEGGEILAVVSSLSPAPGVVVPARITARAVRVRPRLLR